MDEFNQMKHQELVEQYNQQSELINKYRTECKENNDHLRK